MHVSFLEDHPHWAPVLAAWHVREWGAMYPEWGVSEALGELRDHRRSAVPFSLVLHAGQTLLGSVSVVPEDHPAMPPLTPWLASLYVRPEARSRGGGRALVNWAVRHAASLGTGQLHLFTPDHESFYASLGWATITQVDHQAWTFTVMQLDTRLGQHPA